MSLATGGNLPEPRPGRRRRWSPAFWLITLFVVQWVLLFTRVAPNWDGAFYYAYARSLVFDGDWHLANDLVLAYPTSGQDFANKRYDLLLTATGYVQNPFAPGTALLWTPWLAAVRLLVTFLGWPEPTAYEWPFTLGAAALSALAGLAAFGLVWRLAADVAGRHLATLATLTLGLATPLIHYQFREPYYSHTTSALVVALCVVVWYAHAQQPTPPTPGQGFLLGALVGLAALVRWQHLLYLTLPLLSVVWYAGVRRTIAARVSYACALLAGAGLLFSVQLGLWRLFYGTWITVPQGESFIVWNAAWLRPALFSTFHGLFTWMPLAALAVWGLWRLAWRRPVLGLPLLMMLALQTYVNASTPDWFGGGGFGPRRYTSELVIWGIGYAAFLAGLPRPNILGVLIGSLLAWHQWTLLRYALALRLGGQVVSMAPTFEWVDTTWREFGRQIGLYASQLWRQPGDYFLFQDSPFHQWQQGQLPVEQAAALSGAVLGVGLIAALYWLAPQRLKTRPVGIGLTVALTVMAHLWLIWRA